MTCNKINVQGDILTLVGRGRVKGWFYWREGNKLILWLHPDVKGLFVIVSKKCFTWGFNLPYRQKIWRFGSLACDRQIKFHQYFILAYMRMVIPYWTAKFKSANIFTMVIWDPTAKFNSRQYFQLYSTSPIAAYWVL